MKILDHLVGRKIKSATAFPMERDAGIPVDIVIETDGGGAVSASAFSVVTMTADGICASYPSGVVENLPAPTRGARCPRCHHPAPNEFGCAKCNPVELGKRLTAALARVAKLEEIIGLLPDTEELATPTVWAQAVSHGTFKVYTTESPSGETLVAVKLPANCTVHSADHLGIGPAQLARIVEMGVAIGRHWRDQEGVNASLLDELASAVPPDAPKHPGFLELAVRETPEQVRIEPRVVDLTAAFDLKPGDRVRIGTRTTVVESIAMYPAQGEAMLRFTQGWLTVDLEEEEKVDG